MKDLPNTYEVGYEARPTRQKRYPNPLWLAFGVFVLFFLVLIAAGMGGWI